MNNTIRIKKVHLGAQGEVAVQYEQFNETTRAWGGHSLSECEPALDSFQASLDALAPMVRKYREEGVIDLDKYSVTGASFFYGKTETPGAEAPYKVLISAHRSLSQWGPATANTPRLQVTADDEDATVVTDDEALKIEAVTTEAIRYIDGERKQVEMAFDDKDEAGEDELPFGDEDNTVDADFEVVGGDETESEED